MKSLLAAVILILPIAFGVFFFIPSQEVEAQGRLIPGSDITQLAPVCGGLGLGTIRDNGEVVPQCTVCFVVQYAERMLNFAIVVAGLIATGVFIYAGFLYMTAVGNPGKISEAHGVFTKVIIGIVLVLTAWTLVDIFMQTLVGNRLDAPWHSILCAPTVTSFKPVPKGTPTTQTTSEQGGATTGEGASTVIVPEDTQTTEPTSRSITGGPAVSTLSTTGQVVSVDFMTTRDDVALGRTYTSVNNTYSQQIIQACQSYGTSVPLCREKIAAIIVAESSGDPNAPHPGGISVGLMGVKPENALNGCALTNVACNINSGVAYFDYVYKQFGNTPNAIAAYNGGPAVASGKGTEGKDTAMAPSKDCRDAGLYAWQCPINPGGLTETQGYVANICRTLTLKGSGC